jgi:hypothetical protein
MKTVTLTLVVLLMVGVGASIAGYQVKRHVGALTSDGWQIQSRDGRVGLTRKTSGPWFISAPTITDGKGLFLCGDPEGKSPTALLSKDRGPHGNWAFEFSERWEPEKAGRKEGLSNAHLLVGKSGFRFKMKLADGPFRNWYVGVEPLPREANGDTTRVPDWRSLILTPDPKSAAVFDYCEVQFEVGHK